MGAAEIFYLRSSDGASEGGHEVRIGDRIVRVLPDTRTSGLRRSRAITGALGTIPDEDPHPAATLAARLVAQGFLVETLTER